MDWQENINNGETTWNEYFDTCKGGNEYVVDLIKNTNDLSKLEGQDLVNACNSAREAAIAHNATLKQQTLGAKAASVGMKALSTAGNMLAMWGISEVIGLAAKGIDYLINYEEKQAEAFENAKKNAKAAEEEIAKLTKTQKESISSISSISDEFAKLYQGVDQSTNENLTLTNEEYERFLELNNQIADSFEDSVLKWDENGNAILNFAGNVEQINNQIKDLLETQKLLNQQETNEKVESYIDGEGDSEGVTVALEGYKAELEYKKIKQDILNQLKNRKDIIFDRNSSEAKAYTDILKDLGLEYNKDTILNPFLSDVTGSDNIPDLTYKLKDESYNKIKEKFNKLEEAYTDEVSKTEKIIESQNQRISSVMMQWAQGESEYQNAEEDKQTLMSKMIGQISWDEDGDFDSYTDKIKDQIFNKVDSAFENIKFRTQLQVLFETDFSKLSAEDAIAKLREYVRNLIDSSEGKFTYEKDPETGLSDYDRFMQAFGGGTGGIIANAKAKNQVLAYATGKTYSKKGSSDYASAPQNHKNFSEKDIRQVMFENGIDTQPEYEAFLELLKNDKIVNIQELNKALQTLKISSADDIVKFLNILEQDIINTIDDAVSESKVEENGGHKSFDTAWEDLDTSKNDDLKDLKNNLLELAEAGKLTTESFEEQKGADLFLNQIDMTAEEATKKVNELVEETKQLSAMRTGITAITSAYDEKKDSKNKTVSSVTLESMSDTLGVSEWNEKDLDVWEKYKSIAADGTKGTKELKEAQDALATSFVNNGNYLANLTSENQAYYQSLLQEMGVTNADQIIKQQLIINEDELTTKKINSKLATVDLVSATDTEIAGLGNELTNLYGTSEALGLYVLKKQLANKNALKTSDSISNLIGLAKQCGLTGKAIKELQRLQQLVDKRKSLASEPMDARQKNELLKIDSDIAKQEKKVDKIANKKVKVKTSTTLGNNSNGSPDSKKDKNGASKESKQTFDWIERRLKNLQNVIDFTASKLQNLFSVKAKNKNLDKQIKTTTKLINAYGTAANKYQQKADKIAGESTKTVKGEKKKVKTKGLSKNIIQKIKTGKLTKKTKLSSLISEYGQSTAEKIQSYIDYYDKAQDAKKNKQDQIAKKRELEQQKSQNYVALYDSRIARAEAKEAIAIGADNKNKSVETQIKNTKLSYQYQIKIAKLTKNKAEADKLQYEMEKKVAELKLQQIQNLQDEYENRVGLIDNDAQDINNAISLAEARGQTVSAGYYQGLNKLQTTKRQETVSQRNKVQAELAAALKDGSIKVGSDEWYDIQSTLQGLDDTINECDVNIAENTTAIRELHTTMLEEMAENANRMNSEADFLAALLSRDELTDSDTGTFTSAGIGTLGTYGINMETAQSQMRELDKERAILEQMKKTGSLDYGDNGKHKYDSLNQLEEAYNNIIEKQKEWTQNEFDAEQKIIDLMKERYQAQLDYMKEIIDARKESLNLIKDLYNYQKSIAEKTKNIATLEKRLTALKGDTSEEGRARMTQIQLQLDEANQDLQDTERERFISDQQNMLDNMYTEYEDLVNHLFKDTDKLLQEGIQAINSNGGFIKSILDKKAEEYGYNYSDNFRGIMDAFTASDSIVTVIRDSINSEDESSISKKLDAINTTIENKYNPPETNPPENGGGGAGGNNGGSGGKSNPKSSNSQQTQTSNGQTTVKPDALDKIQGTSKKRQALEAALNSMKGAGFEKYWTKKKGTPKSYINQRIAAEPNYDKVYPNGKRSPQILTEKGLKLLAKKLGVKYPSSGKSKTADLNKYVKEAGFRTGGIGKLVKASGEDGFALVRNGEGFVAPEHVESIKELMNIVPDMTQFTTALTNVKPVNREIGNTFGDINVQLDLPNVENAQDLVSELQTNNSRTQKAFIIAVKDLVAKGKITNNIQSIR